MRKLSGKDALLGYQGNQSYDSSAETQHGLGKDCIPEDPVNNIPYVYFF